MKTSRKIGLTVGSALVLIGGTCWGWPRPPLLVVPVSPTLELVAGAKWEVDLSSWAPQERGEPELNLEPRSEYEGLRWRLRWTDEGGELQTTDFDMSERYSVRFPHSPITLEVLEAPTLAAGARMSLAGSFDYLYYLNTGLREFGGQVGLATGVVVLGVLWWRGRRRARSTPSEP